MNPISSYKGSETVVRYLKKKNLKKSTLPIQDKECEQFWKK